MMQIIWITVGVLLTFFLVALTVIYLILVIGLWCPRDDYNKKGGSGL
jgi:hypothetical protein